MRTYDDWAAYLKYEDAYIPLTHRDALDMLIDREMCYERPLPSLSNRRRWSRWLRELTAEMAGDKDWQANWREDARRFVTDPDAVFASCAEYIIDHIARVNYDMFCWNNGVEYVIHLWGTGWGNNSPASFKACRWGKQCGECRRTA